MGSSSMPTTILSIKFVICVSIVCSSIIDQSQSFPIIKSFLYGQKISSRFESYPRSIQWQPSIEKYRQWSDLYQTNKLWNSKKKNVENEIKDIRNIEFILKKYQLDWNLITFDYVEKLNDDEGFYIMRKVRSNDHHQQQKSKFPIIAEIYVGGIVRLGVIHGLKEPNSNDISESSPPLIHVTILDFVSMDVEMDMNTNKNVDVDVDVDNINSNQWKDMVVDIGQITTIWELTPMEIDALSTTKAIHILSKLYTKAKQSLGQELAVNQSEQAMQGLWKSRVGRGRGQGKGAGAGAGAGAGEISLTKKQIHQFKNEHVQNVLRKTIKAGNGMSRLITSFDTIPYIYKSDSKNNHDNDRINSQRNGLIQIYRRMIGSELLALDAELGGRFRRFSCTFVSAEYEKNVPKLDSTMMVKSMTILNGGWVATDASVRAGTEARKFAERAIDHSLTSTHHHHQQPQPQQQQQQWNTNESNDKHKKQSSSSTENPFVYLSVKTAADERIAQRLECLAMGENLYPSNPSTKRRDTRHARDASNNDTAQLELDVRETLSSMNLPISPTGARDALIQIGRWSLQKDANDMHSGGTIDPWSNATMHATRELVLHEQKRQQRLMKVLLSHGHSHSHSHSHDVLKKKAKQLEYRVDLTSLPCVCIDAKNVAFRDDAIGVRPRSATGRKIEIGASKWEILIHITDVSDIYSPQIDDASTKSFPSNLAIILRKAAESRGLSRYDLPLGPLHLLPPVALDVLALDVHKISFHENPSKHETKSKKTNVNRCVTLWVYIDERNGNVLDMGLERTLISTPVALTFSDASKLMEEMNDTINPNLLKTKAILSIVERNLSLWSQQYQIKNKAAYEREKRMVAKEVISRETNLTQKKDNRSFERTRGHRIVDSALDLYAYGLDKLLKQKKANIPRASGSGADRGGRLGTAPLRRYIDGMAQRQALSVLCNGYGGPPMTRSECSEANRIAGKASNALNNYRAIKSSGGGGGGNMGVVGAAKHQARQRDALRSLARHLATMGVSSGNNKVQAISTGRENEVAVLGSGAVAKCRGVKGSLKLGEQVMVEILKLEPEKNILRVKLCNDDI